MLVCNLSNGAALTQQYTVYESGNITGYTIDPITSCTLNSDMHWQFEYDPYSNPRTAQGGNVRAQSFAPFHKFTLSCPTVFNTTVEVSTSRTGANGSGCNLNNSDLSSYEWPTSTDPSGQFPTELLPRSYYSPIAIPIDRGAAHDVLYCGQTSLSGDSHWFSYRSTPNSRPNWTVTASRNPSAAPLATDNNSGTRWTTNGIGQAGDYYQVDRGNGMTPANWYNNYTYYTNLTMDSGSDVNDYARKFTLLVSQDGVNYVEVGHGSGSARFVSLNIGQNSDYTDLWQQYFRIRLDENLPNGQWWSIREVKVQDMYNPNRP